MRLILAIFLAVGTLAAQEPSAQPAQEAPSPAPATEQWLTGNIEFGNRWVSDVRGNAEAYRSVVNLGEGPKLFGLDLTLTDPSRRLFDSAVIRANSWGGDPYNTASVDVRRERSYNLSFDYRNIAYFNSLPSFANPAVDRGIFLSQRSFDIQRRMIDTELELMPGSRIIPYVAFSRDWGAGSGVTSFVTDGNEFAVANDLRDRTNNFRGGVRVELNRFHATFEQGGTNFKDHQRLFHSPGPHYGNRTVPLLGRQTLLSTLEQAYRVEGDSVYTKGLVTTNPASWVNLYGQFLYSRPDSDVSYSQDNSGKFVSFDPPLSSLRLFDSQMVLLTSESKQPHTSGSFGAELRLHRRIRVTEAVMTDRFHTTGSALLQETLAAGTVSATSSGVPPGLEKLIFNYSRQEVNVLADVLPRLTLRGGHRYVWGDAQVRAPQLSQTGTVENGELKMHVGLAGFVFRAAQKLTVSADFEGGSADRNYFRTSLQDYKKLSARANYQVLNSLNMGARFSLLDNQNPAQNIRNDFLSRDNSITVLWTPAGGKRVSLLGDYSRSTLRSDLLAVVPSTLQSELSTYAERAHTGTALLEINLPDVQKASPKLSLGGSFFKSSGSRPTEYYQPIGRFSVPFHRKVRGFFEWRWYRLFESFYQYEGFRTHQFVGGLQLAL